MKPTYKFRWLQCSINNIPSHPSAVWPIRQEYGRIKVLQQWWELDDTNGEWRDVEIVDVFDEEIKPKK